MYEVNTIVNHFPHKTIFTLPDRNSKRANSKHDLDTIYERDASKTEYPYFLVFQSSLVLPSVVAEQPYTKLDCTGLNTNF